jgi:hypothetical protein
MESAYQAMASCAIVFLDPDNGLSPKLNLATRDKGQKYLFPRGLKGYLDRQQSPIVYHHQTRELDGLRVHIENTFSFLRTYGARRTWTLVFRCFSVLHSKTDPSALG